MRHRLSDAAILAALLFLLLSSMEKEAQLPDRPRLTPNVVLRDITFRSTALGREMQYRVILPAAGESGRKLQVVYLLHGGGGGFRDWANDSAVARLGSRACCW